MFGPCFSVLCSAAVSLLRKSGSWVLCSCLVVVGAMCLTRVAVSTVSDRGINWIILCNMLNHRRYRSHSEFLVLRL